jgi:hypothetical protein
VARRADIAKHAVTVVSLGVLAAALYYGFRWDRAAPAPSPTPAPAGAARTPSERDAALPGAPQGPHPAPVNVFTAAAVGDWSAFRVDNKSPLLEATTTVLWTVTSANDDEVVVGGRGRLDTGEEKTLRDLVFPRADLTLERLLQMDYSGWKILQITSSEEVHEVGGRAFACTRVTFTSSDPLFPDKRTETRIWFSPEVTGSGIVESREVQLLGDVRFEITKTLIGFGNADKTTWGERPPSMR